MADFEWDEAKRKANFAKHKIDFKKAIEIFDQPNLVFRSQFLDEERFIALGWLDQRDVAVVFTMRGERRRIISARRARKDERKKIAELKSRSGDD